MGRGGGGGIPRGVIRPIQIFINFNAEATEIHGSLIITQQFIFSLTQPLIFSKKPGTGTGMVQTRTGFFYAWKRNGEYALKTILSYNEP